MKRLLIYFLVFMVIFSLWTLISQREARQKALAHTGAGYFEVKNTKIVLDEKGVYWKVAVRDNSIKEKPSEYTVNVSYFSSEFK